MPCEGADALVVRTYFLEPFFQSSEIVEQRLVSELVDVLDCVVEVVHRLTAVFVAEYKHRVYSDQLSHLQY